MPPLRDDAEHARHLDEDDESISTTHHRRMMRVVARIACESV
jgi:hypothetical protein